MRRWLLVAGCLYAAVPAQANAQQSIEKRGLVLRVDGPVAVAAGDTVGALIVINGDARVDGVVTGALVVVNGTARVSGQVGEDAVIARGHLDLEAGAFIGEDVLLYAGTMAEAPSARVAGEVHDEAGVSFSARASWLLWLSLTLVLVIGGLLFAGFAGDQLVEGVRILAREPGRAAAGAVVLWIGLPSAALIAFMTVIGIPLGFVILFMVVPAVTVLGYIVSGTVLGAALIRRREGWRQAGGRLYAEAALGLFTLQLLALVPLFGGIAALLASAAGAGALGVRSWRKFRAAPVGEAEPAAEEQVELPV